MKINERDGHGWVGIEYGGYIVDSEEPEFYEMLGLLFAEDILMMINPPALFVLANDLFAWGCADGESITWDEVPGLFKMVIANSKWGATRWCCIHRNEQPQDPVKRQMQEAGVWDEVLESLPLNGYSTRMRAKAVAK